MFSKNSFAIIYGLHLSTAQKMLDFDFICEREPSVVAFVDPGKDISNYKLFFGGKEMFITSYPDYESIPDSILKKADTVLNYASFRSAYDATLKSMEIESIKNIIIIAEWIPESCVRKIIALNKEKKKNIIGPSTVWAMVNGEFRVGNTGGSLENIINSKLYKKWSIWFVSKSGWMSNELRKIIADNTNWTHTSVAIGWDKYSIATFKDIILQYEKIDEIKMIVLLGEVGWNEENEIALMIKNKIIKKPVVAFCIGTISDLLPSGVQFGHAGAKADSNTESSNYKNLNLKNAWAVVPESFMDLWEKIKETFQKLYIKNDSDIEMSELQKKVEIINSRKSTKMTSTISDERWEELTYNKKPISEYIQKGSIANVIWNLWLKRDLPEYALKFINTIIILLADHGPAVSGATNTIITSRAGNDLKSGLISWLATVGPRFGGAIDWAGKYFFEAVKNGVSPKEYVDMMKKKWEFIPWIGHKVKSKFNPDKRCELLLELSKEFPSTKHLEFALEVEKITLDKKPNLILNVDGMTAVLLLDMMKDIGMSNTEIQKYIEAWIFNGFFILSRNIGFIWHFIDQKLLNEPLYRSDWDDILYI